MPKKLITLASCIALAACTAAVVQVLRTRAQESIKRCLVILDSIDGSKQAWAVEHKMGPDALPTWDDLNPYIKSPPPSWAQCPSGGTYTIGRVRELPSCSIASHQRAFKARVRTLKKGWVFPDFAANSAAYR